VSAPAPASPEERFFHLPAVSILNHSLCWVLLAVYPNCPSSFVPRRRELSAVNKCFGPFRAFVACNEVISLTLVPCVPPLPSSAAIRISRRRFSSPIFKWFASAILPEAFRDRGLPHSFCLRFQGCMAAAGSSFRLLSFGPPIYWRLCRSGSCISPVGALLGAVHRRAVPLLAVQTVAMRFFRPSLGVPLLLSLRPFLRNLATSPTVSNFTREALTFFEPLAPRWRNNWCSRF